MNEQKWQSFTTELAMQVKMRNNFFNEMNKDFFLNKRSYSFKNA